MKIKLVRMGGFIPLTKAAEAEVDLTDQELARLLEIIRSDDSAPRVKDGNSYELTAGSKSTPIDLEKVPDEYRALFVKMKGDLRIVK